MDNEDTGDAGDAGSIVQPYSAEDSFDAGTVSAVVPFHDPERPVYLLGPGIRAGRRGSRFHIRSG
ncbi:MAG: hypothetical protein QMC81_00195 [Thermoanaerobacterales bacterium]|nr:hypothetical protein [Bacillota bacterium]MDI6905892.1 hypothetical protein [Thermoanaerobacterales bacterium]